MPLIRYVMLAVLCASTLSAQVRQLRAVPDPSFDASALELSSPPSLRVNRQNQAFVTDREGKRMVRLSVDGRQADLIVREGSGPGEAKGFVALGWKADTLVFFDNWQSRFTLLDSSGKFIKTLPMHERCNTFGSVLMLGDGCLEFLQPPSRPGLGAQAGAPFPVVITSQQKKRTDTLGIVSREHSVMVFEGNDRMSYSTQPFHDDATILPALRGTAAIEIQRPAARSPASDSIRLRRWSPASGWGRWSVLRYEPLPLADRVIDSALAVQAEGMRKSSGWVTLDSFQAKAYRPRFFPPVPLIMSTTDGRIWLRLVHARVPAGSSTWVVLDERLIEQARVTLPTAFRPLDVRGELTWGYELDEDDVPTLVRYKLVAAQ